MALAEALDEAVQMLDNAKKPVIIADRELIRQQLQQPFATLLEKTGYPYGILIPFCSNSIILFR